MLSWATIHNATRECKNNTLLPFCLLMFAWDPSDIYNSNDDDSDYNHNKDDLLSSLLLIATHLLSTLGRLNFLNWLLWTVLNCTNLHKKPSNLSRPMEQSEHEWLSHAVESYRGLDGTCSSKKWQLYSPTLWYHVTCTTLWYRVPYFDAMRFFEQNCIFFVVVHFFRTCPYCKFLEAESWNGNPPNKAKDISAQSQAHKELKPICKSWKASVPIAPVGTCPEKTTIGTPSVKASCGGSKYHFCWFFVWTLIMINIYAFFAQIIPNSSMENTWPESVFIYVPFKLQIMYCTAQRCLQGCGGPISALICFPTSKERTHKCPW